MKSRKVSKGYKGTYNLVCRDMQYEVGKTYNIHGALEMCGNGYHFCREAKDVLYFYRLYTPDFVLVEVKASGKFIETHNSNYGNKVVTEQIEIVRIVPEAEYPSLGLPAITRHADGSVTYVTDEHTRRYVNGMLIYIKQHISGREFWYDLNEQLIKNVTKKGDTYYYKYDSIGNRKISTIRYKKR